MHKKSRSARQQPELFPSPNILLTHSPVRSTPKTTTFAICHSKALIKSTKILLNHLTMTVPTSCCGRSGQSCVCASKAKCSCGKQSALHCNCEKAKTENVVGGARCSCRKPISHSQAQLFRIPLSTYGVYLGKVLNVIMLTSLLYIGARPAGQCTCDRAATENAKVAGATCACGVRPASKYFNNAALRLHLMLGRCL